MGLFRNVIERSAESARQLRSRLAAPATDTPAATPSMTPGEDSLTPQHQEIKPSTTATAARLTQLVGENPPPGSLARVIRRKYQSVARERERIAMVSAASRDSSNGSASGGVSGGGGAYLSSETHNDLRDAIEQYEIEFPKLQDTALGIELETDFYGRHTVIKSVKRGSVAFALHAAGFMRPGHVVVGVNGQDLSQLSFEQVLCAIKEAAVTTRVVRFVNPSVLPMKLFKFEPSLVNRDQYGFAKDDRYILSYRKQLRKQKSMSYPHEKKWTEFVQRSGGVDALDEWMSTHGSDASGDATHDSAEALELRTLVLSGVPVVLRPRVWSVLAGVTKYKKRFGTQYFRQLVAERDTSPSAADIEKDICRTYPEHPFFQTEKGKSELKNVLCAYSLHNPSVGYCQSMNFIAGMLLLFMAEEDAFWLLSVMLHKRYLPAENYTQSMLGMQTDQLVFKWLVASELPELAARLEHCGIQIQLVTLHWFLCAFVCTLPTETALRIWDWFFLDGERVLFAVAIGILKLAAQEVLSAATHSDVHNIVRGLGTDLHDEDAFMRFLLSTRSNADGSWGNSHPIPNPLNSNSPVSDGVRKMDASRTASAPAPVSPQFASPEPSKPKGKASTRLTPSAFLQQLFLPDSPQADRSASAATARFSPAFAPKFTMREIEQKRAEFRAQIELKSRATLSE
ncbi:hypothetical protein PybrP1_007458 [[Pythium] brassicae (nom. inval.)]|nr:hypothetical protein PybrP1_007458 [[Pythium] brassicae (nom. inval.)]